MKRIILCIATIATLMFGTACEPTSTPRVNDDLAALDLKFILSLTEGGLEVLDDWGLAEAVLSGVAKPDPDTGEPRQVEWINYREPDPTSPDGWRHYESVMPFSMDVPGFEYQRIYPEQVARVTFTATVDLFMGWTFSCAIADAKTGAIISTNTVANPEENGQIVLTATVNCYWV